MPSNTIIWEVSDTFDHTRQSKISNLDRHVLRQQHVSQLQIPDVQFRVASLCCLPVKNSSGVDIVEPQQYLPCVVLHFNLTKLFSIPDI